MALALGCTAVIVFSEPRVSSTHHDTEKIRYGLSPIQRGLEPVRDLREHKDKKK